MSPRNSNTRSLRTQMLVASLCPIALCGACIGYAAIETANIRQRVDFLAQRVLDPRTLASEVSVKVGASESLRSVQEAMTATEPDQRSGALKAAAEKATLAKDAIATLSASPLDERHTKLLGSVAVEFDALHAVVTSTSALLKKDTMLATEEAQTRFAASAPPAQKAFGDALAALDAYRAELVTQAHTNVTSATTGVRFTLIGGGVLAGLVGCAFALIYSGRIVRRVRALLASLSEIHSTNNLTIPVPVQGKDEIASVASAVQDLVSTLRTIIAEVNSSSSDVAAAATQIAASTQQVTTSVSSAASDASEAARIASESGSIAAESGRTMQSTIEAMQGIHASVATSTKSVQALGQRGQQIGEIVGLINEIADQTNLLALNAAIEAARAGEHGRGFAVVADEVRKLAERTTKATEQVTSHIREIQQETRTAVATIGQGATLVESGVQVAQRSGDQLQVVVQSSSTVTDRIQRISATSNEVQAALQQAACASEQLSSKAEQLDTLIKKFKA